MKDHRPQQDGDKKPQRQTGEEHGTIRGSQRDGHHPRERSDTPRGSEPETRASSSRRG
jgi:hypothetical protein